MELRPPLPSLPDADLVAQVGAVLRTPRRDPADSFVLHAPLELAARARLLPLVDPVRREQARLRFAVLAASYEAWGPAAAEPEPREFGSPAEAAVQLVDAIDAGDLDRVDAVASWLGARATADELRGALAADLVARLAAAAHAPILLYQLLRVGLDGGLLRPPARELARNPDRRIRWHEPVLGDRRAPGTGPSDALFDAIAATPHLGEPGSTFIDPLMSQVDGSGVVAELLAAPLREAGLQSGARAIIRAAALSMLLEPPDHAPYGWSHALTMSQAVLDLALELPDPRVALAVAATYVVGFRAAHAREPLTAEYAPEPPDAGWREAVGIAPAVAAAAVWHAPSDELDDVVTELATRAAVAHDAHLVKYTLACLDATRADPEHRRLYLAAAASLVAWWEERGDPDDPLAGRDPQE